MRQRSKENLAFIMGLYVGIPVLLAGVVITLVTGNLYWLPMAITGIILFGVANFILPEKASQKSIGNR